MYRLKVFWRGGEVCSGSQTVSDPPFKFSHEPDQSPEFGYKSSMRARTSVFLSRVITLIRPESSIFFSLPRKVIACEKIHFRLSIDWQNCENRYSNVGTKKAVTMGLEILLSPIAAFLPKISGFRIITRKPESDPIRTRLHRKRCRASDSASDLTSSLGAGSGSGGPRICVGVIFFPCNTFYGVARSHGPQDKGEDKVKSHV